MRASEMKTQSPSGSRGRAGVRISNLPPRILNCTVIDKMAVQFFAALWAWGKSLQDGGAQTAFWGKAP